MSKLDYVTIGIVVICIAAIVFLVIKTSNLMNQPEPGLEPNRIDQALEDRDSYPGRDTFDYTSPADTGYASPTYDQEDLDDDQVDTYDPLGDDRPAPRTSQPAPRTTPSAPPASETLTPRGGSTATATAAGGYLVLAGSFRYKANAEQMVQRLRKLGYDQAEVGLFNRGTYAVAMVRRFDDAASARALVDELKSKHNIDARVKKQ